jgi:hypothetical protein
MILSIQLQLSKQTRVKDLGRLALRFHNALFLLSGLTQNYYFFIENL